MSGYYYEPPDPPKPPHVGPVVEDYDSIGAKLKVLEKESSERIQATPLPEPGPVPERKPWWSTDR